MDFPRLLSYLFLLLLIPFVASAEPAGLAQDIAPGQALVRFQPGASVDSPALQAAFPGCRLVRSYPALSRQCGAACGLLELPEPPAGVAALAGADFVARLQALDIVGSASPNARRKRMDVEVPSDPRAADQWGFENDGSAGGTVGKDIRFRPAWALARSAPYSGVIVAVVDTGVDYRHRDLIDNMWINSAEIPDNGIDDDNNGFIDDIYGADLSGDAGDGPDGDPMDPGAALAHGSHVAGLVAGSIGNELGGNGVHPGARIMALKASTDGVFFSSGALIAAYDYTLAMRLRGEPVVAMNASYGGGLFVNMEIEAIEALGDAGIVLIAAAGNDGRNIDVNPVFPANFPLANIITVGSTDRSDGLSGFSNFGEQNVDIAAPGSDILSVVPSHVEALAEVNITGQLFTGEPMLWSGMTGDGGFRGTVVECGIGRPEEFPAAVAGQVALIQRGTLFFQDKVSNAQDAGAEAVVIYNNVPGVFFGTLRKPSGGNIPAIGVSAAIGTNLLAAVGTRVTVFNRQNEAGAYTSLSGTSFSAPMVAGAVALAAEHWPNDTMAQRIARVLDAADELPGLTSTITQGRRLNLLRIMDSDGDELPDWWEETHSGGLDLDPEKDEDNDGTDNRTEFLAGTDPFAANDGILIRYGANVETLEWQGLTGRRYRIRSTQNLNGAFLDMQTDILGTPPLNQIQVAPSAMQGFFRLDLDCP